MQQDFYNEIAIRYNEYVEYLKQIGEYDLEVEAMDLKAETIASRPLIIGKGGDSEFGNDSILETVMANVLRKPFSKAELNNLLNEALQGRNPKNLQQEIIDDFEQYAQTELERDLSEAKSHYEGLIRELPKSTWLKNILARKGQAVYDEELEKETKRFEETLKLALEKINRQNRNLRDHLGSFFNTLSVGKNLNYPVKTFEAGQQLIPATFLGFVIDRKKKSPNAEHHRHAALDHLDQLAHAGALTPQEASLRKKLWGA